MVIVMVQSKWFESIDTVYPEVITRNGISVAIRGTQSVRVTSELTVPKNKIIDNQIYIAARVFAGDTKSALLRVAREKAKKYKADYQSIRIVPLTVKGYDLVVMYVVEKEVKRSSPKYTCYEVKSEYK